MAKKRRRRRRSRRSNPAPSRARSRRRRRRNGRARRRSRYRRRRNPGGGSAFKTVLRSAIPGIIAGFGIGFLNAKMLADKTTAVKLAAAGGLSLVAAYVLRRRPVAAVAAIAGIAGASAAAAGTKSGGGGVVADTESAEGQKQMQALIKESPSMGYILGQNPNRMPALSGMPIGGPNYTPAMPDLF